MKRALITFFAVTLVSLTVVPAFAADNVDLKSQDGIKKFWEQRQHEGSGSGDGG